MSEPQVSLDGLDSFLQALVSEENASPHTLKAYRNDLVQFSDYLTAAGHSSFDLKESGPVFDFLDQERESGISLATSARRLSSIRMFIRFLTAEGRIKVTGTAISVYKGDDFTCVCVLEGTARIGKDEARMEDVGAGLRKVMFSGDRPSKVVDIEPHHAEELVKFLERNAGVFPSH